MQHHILYSLDYELYWVKNSSEIDVLVRPTERLLAIAEKLGIKFTIFVDYLCIARYRKEGLDDFVCAVEAQLKDAVSRGHDVQVHIHPHWLTAQYKEGSWIYDTKDFLVGDHSSSKNDIYQFAKGLLTEAKAYFETLLVPVKSDYQALAFRAGGYGLQPGEKQFIKALIDTGYLIDSTITPGLKLETDRNQIDFSDVPKQANFFIDENSGINKASSKGLFEVPIPGESISYRAMYKRVRRYLKDRRNRPMPLYGTGSSLLEGWGASVESGTLMGSVKRKMEVISKRHAFLRIPEDPDVLIDLTKKWILKRSSGQFCDFSLLIHPKGLSQKMLDDLKAYHGLLEKNFGTQVLSTTFFEVAQGVREHANGIKSRC
jgi:hypothetical protein